MAVKQSTSAAKYSATVTRPHKRVPESPGGGRVAWLSLGQAAKYLGVSESTLRKWSDEGRVPAFSTPGGHRRFRTRDLDDFLESLRVTADAGEAPRVLIVAAEERLRAGVRYALEADGCIVNEAATAAEGLAQLDETPPDVILLDLTMPDLDGIDVLCRLHARHGLDAVPAIVFGREGARGSTAGVSALAGDPDPRRLVDAARELLGARTGGR